MCSLLTLRNFSVPRTTALQAMPEVKSNMYWVPARFGSSSPVKERPEKAPLRTNHPIDPAVSSLEIHKGHI